MDTQQEHGHGYGHDHGHGHGQDMDMDIGMDKTRTRLLLDRHGQRTTLFSEGFTKELAEVSES
jgi:hypothetical protein